MRVRTPNDGVPGIYKCSRPSGVVEPDQHVGGNTIKEKEMDEYVARKIMAVLVAAEGDPETLGILAEATRRLAKYNEVPGMRSERAALLGERVETEKGIERLYDDLGLGIHEGAIGRARFLQDKEVLEERLVGIERRIGEVGALELPVLPIAEWTYTEAPDGDPLGEGSWWEKADVADRRMLASLFVDEIRVKKAAGRGGSNRVCQVEKRVSVRMAQAQREEAELDVVQAAWRHPVTVMHEPRPAPQPCVCHQDTRSGNNLDRCRVGQSGGPSLPGADTSGRRPPSR